ncbi:hypothetical protein [Roseicyclus amphidinii]|uniref:hypothetical protein n=1 Tax=Roseicyclus amphidinii TaxID=3034232 RepID=UPI0024E0BE3C|nr:hypothetical protein [Roseicyclus sp. Amp-Y-6]
MDKDRKNVGFNGPRDPSPFALTITSAMHDNDLPFEPRAFIAQETGTLTLREPNHLGELQDNDYPVTAGQLIGPFANVKQVRTGSVNVIARA